MSGLRHLASYFKTTKVKNYGQFYQVTGLQIICFRPQHYSHVIADTKSIPFRQHDMINFKNSYYINSYILLARFICIGLVMQIFIIHFGTWSCSPMSITLTGKPEHYKTIT